MTTSATSDKLCTRCQGPIPAGAELYCRMCGKPHHHECWNAAGRCASPDCTGTQAVGAAGTGTLPPPPQPFVTPAQGGVYTPIEGFTNEISLSAAINNGWNAFRNYLGLSIGAYLIFMVITYAVSFVLGIIPGVGPFLSILITAPLTGGWIIYTLNVMRNRDPQIGDLFAGFQQYWPFLGANLLLAAAGMAVVIIPAILGAVVFPLMAKARATGGGDVNPALVALFGVLIVAAVVIMIMLYIRWFFVLYLIADGHGILESFGLSAEMTEGRRLSLFGISFVLGLLGIAGMLACVVGLLFTLPLAMFAMTSLYITARNERFGQPGF